MCVQGTCAARANVECHTLVGRRGVKSSMDSEWSAPRHANYSTQESSLSREASRCPRGKEGTTNAPTSEEKWQPTPVLLPGKFHGWRSLVDYSPWGRKEPDKIE